MLKLHIFLKSSFLRFLPYFLSEICCRHCNKTNFTVIIESIKQFQ